MVFCNTYSHLSNQELIKVTILILIDGFLQCIIIYDTDTLGDSHNPYFNRWFSAMTVTQKKLQIHIKVTILILIDGFLQ